MYNLISMEIKGEDTYYFIDKDCDAYLDIIDNYRKSERPLVNFISKYQRINIVDFAQYEQNTSKLNYSIEISEDSNYIKVFDSNFKIVYRNDLVVYTNHFI